MEQKTQYYDNMEDIEKEINKSLEEHDNGKILYLLWASSKINYNNINEIKETMQMIKETLKWGVPIIISLGLGIIGLLL